MVFDPDFSDFGTAKPNPKTTWSWVRWFIVYPLLGLSGCHMLLTGSPVPLWSTEQLDHPVVVRELADNKLILADGRSISLPFIKRLPKNDSVFLRALKHGVEVGQDGEIVGLITFYSYCGNDPFHWRTMRINLSDLAGFMYPDGIDDSIIHPDAIKFLKENDRRALDRHGLPYFVMSQARKMRQVYEASESNARKQRNPIRSFGRDQLDQ